MPTKVRVWDVPVRVFHWLLAASFILAYVVSESEGLLGTHVVLGYTALGLIAFRILWGFVGSRYARFSSFLFSPAAAIAYARGLFAKRPQQYLGHNPLGSYAIYAILVIGLATGITGYMRLNEMGGDSIEELHEVFANVWLGIVVLHVIGVIVGSWMHRENLARAMLTGYKDAVEGGTDAENAPASPSGTLGGRIVGILLAVGVGALWVWAYATGYRPVERTADEQRQESSAQEVGPQTRLSDKTERDK